MNDSIELQGALHQFTGTEQWYRYNLNRNMLYTDGVKYFAENAGGGAYWFLDIIATEFFILLATEDFIVITLASKNDKAAITADDGNGNILKTKNIDLTDCPAGNWKFYLADNILLLPSEY